MPTIIIGTAVIGAVVFSLIRVIKKSKTGSACGCGCEHCAQSGQCHK